MTRWRGLKDLVVDAVHHGSIAVERVQQQVARAPLDVLAHVPLLATPARRAASMQAALIASTYWTIRGVTHLVGSIAGLALELVAAGREPPAGGADGASGGGRAAGRASPRRGASASSRAHRRPREGGKG